MNNHQEEANQSSLEELNNQREVPININVDIQFHVDHQNNANVVSISLNSIEAAEEERRKRVAFEEGMSETLREERRMREAAEKELKEAYEEKLREKTRHIEEVEEKLREKTRHFEEVEGKLKEEYEAKFEAMKAIYQREVEKKTDSEVERELKKQRNIDYNSTMLNKSKKFRENV